MDGIVDQHSGRKIMLFLSTTEISEDKFICFIHQTCFKHMMLEKWKKHFLSTSHCWSKVLMHLGQAFSPGCFISQPFLFAPNWFRVPNKNKAGRQPVSGPDGLATARPIFQRVGNGLQCHGGRFRRNY